MSVQAAAPCSDFSNDISENFQGIRLPQSPSTRKHSYSFNLQRKVNEQIVLESKQELSIDDEVQLTLLNVDRQQISEVIEFKQVAAGQIINNFQCYFYKESGEFYMRISEDEIQNQFLSKEILLTLLDLAEEKGAKTFFACIDNNNQLKRKIQEILQFVGFRKLSSREQKQVSLCITHQLLQYNLVADDT